VADLNLQHREKASIVAAGSGSRGDGQAGAFDAAGR
jgi:hypothetical protein